MANESIHIHEIQETLPSSNLNGDELFVVSHPIGANKYTSKKLSLNENAYLVVEKQVNGNWQSYKIKLSEIKSYIVSSPRDSEEAQR